MALETVVFQTDPFSYSCKDLYYNHNHGFGFEEESAKNIKKDLNEYWESSPPCSVVKSVNSSSPEDSAGDGFSLPAVGISGRGKRRRIRSSKNMEQIENQRMTHIAVERNRRKQMNDYLAALRSLMPPSYAQRGDQASIVGGAINYVKELEQLLQFLESHNQIKQASNPNHNGSPPLFANFFTFPQFSTCLNRRSNSVGPTSAISDKRSAIADVEVAMVDSHANIKVLSRKQPKQLLKMVNGFQSLSLTILHLNITTVDDMVLYSLNVKVEDDCQLGTVNEIATAVHAMVGMIQEEAMSIGKS